MTWLASMARPDDPDRQTKLHPGSMEVTSQVAGRSLGCSTWNRAPIPKGFPAMGSTTEKVDNHFGHEDTARRNGQMAFAGAAMFALVLQVRILWSNA